MLRTVQSIEPPPNWIAAAFQHPMSGRNPVFVVVHLIVSVNVWLRRLKSQQAEISRSLPKMFKPLIGHAETFPKHGKMH